MKKFPVAASLAWAIAGMMTLSASHAQGTKAKAEEQSFMTEAMQGDMAEVQMGELAQQKGADEQVKQFGKTLASDHSEHLEKAKSLASTMGLNPPSAVSAKQKATYDELSRLSGTQFDKQFARDMVQDHEADIKKYDQHEKGSGQIAEFAKETVPVLKKHLEMAKSLESGTKTTGSSH